MAEKKSTAEMRTIKLRRDPDPHSSQTEFYSINFHNYLIQRGVSVTVPKEVADLIEANEEAKEAAIIYASEQALREP